MAREKVYSEALNLRVDEALRNEIKRIAERRDVSESDAARMLLGWGVEAHRAMEARELRRPYDAPEPEIPLEMVIDVRWIETDHEDYDDRRRRGFH